MVFGDRLSLDLEFENGGLGDIPQDQYFQTGGAIGIARDREPPPLPKTTQTPSQKAPSGTETKLSKAPATVKEASPTSAHNPLTQDPVWRKARKFKGRVSWDGSLRMPPPPPPPSSFPLWGSRGFFDNRLADSGRTGTFKIAGTNLTLEGKELLTSEFPLSMLVTG
jgi:hypothetical protein